MKVSTKFVKPLSKKQEEEIERIKKENVGSRMWIRCHSIKLSAKGYSIDEIADIYEVDRDTVSIWIDGWEGSGIEGLNDKPKSGRPRILDYEEEQEVKQIAQENPRSIKQIANEVVERVKKK
jgi:transposase